MGCLALIILLQNDVDRLNNHEALGVRGISYRHNGVCRANDWDDVASFFFDFKLGLAFNGKYVRA